jgi:hypothetical protein
MHGDNTQGSQPSDLGRWGEESTSQAPPLSSSSGGAFAAGARHLPPGQIGDLAAMAARGSSDSLASMMKDRGGGGGGTSILSPNLMQAICQAD